jgi:hypothetical protein
MDALIVLGILVALAFAAPRWGYDSTDGVDSPEYRRRAAWLVGRAGTISAPRGSRPARPAPARPVGVSPARAVGSHAIVS